MSEISNLVTNSFDMHKSRNGSLLAYDLEEEKKIIAKGTEELKKELLEKWKKEYANAEIFPSVVAAIHPEVVDFLLSFNLVDVYDDIARQANLDAAGRNELPHIVWEIAQSKNWDSIEASLQSKIKADENGKKLILDLLEKNILGKIRELSNKPSSRPAQAETVKKKEIQMPLKAALEKYPKLGEQNVTVNSLKLKYFPTPVRPSIKNWITDFYDNMGAGKHNSIDRGNFLFHSENGKKLAAIERQKLSVMLKSLDEGAPLAIDEEKQMVIFTTTSMAESEKYPIMSNEHETKQGMNLTKENFSNSISFKSESGRNQTMGMKMPKSEPVMQAKHTEEANLHNNQTFGKPAQSINKSKLFSPDLAAKPGEGNLVHFRHPGNNKAATPSQAGGQKYFNEFSSAQKSGQKKTDSSISFSSPQILPAETEAGAKRQSIAAEPSKRVIWKIKPSGYSDEEYQDPLSKKSSVNVVNLKE